MQVKSWMLNVAVRIPARAHLMPPPLEVPSEAGPIGPLFTCFSSIPPGWLVWYQLNPLVKTSYDSICSYQCNIYISLYFLLAWSVPYAPFADPICWVRLHVYLQAEYHSMPMQLLNTHPGLNWIYQSCIQSKWDCYTHLMKIHLILGTTAFCAYTYSLVKYQCIWNECKCEQKKKTVNGKGTRSSHGIHANAFKLI